MTDNIIAQSLSILKDPSNYQEFKEGYFTHRPELKGYILELKGFRAKVFVIINTAKELYNKNYYSEDGFNFIIYNASSLESFIDKLPDEASEIIKILQDISSKGTKTGKSLPYGYVEDDDGNVKVNPQEAKQVRDIYKEYIETRSIRKVARMQKEDYSFIRDILHDARYPKMPIAIIPLSDIKKVNLIIQQNTKNKYRKSKLRRVL